jgi:plastocyanin
MKLYDLIRGWLRQPTPARPPSPRRRDRRLRLEQLEDRTVPSTFTAASVSELIEDINMANQNFEADTITLVAGTTFTLTAVNNTTHGATGLPVITASDNLTIVGNGDTIQRSTAAGTPWLRLIDVAAGASLTLENLTLQGGLASSSGGAVSNQGTLTLSRVIVQNNTARGYDAFGLPSLPGGSAAGGGLYSSGSLTLEGCLIQNNVAIGGRGGDGSNDPDLGHDASPGGIAIGGGLYVGGGTVTISNSTLTANTAQGGAGGNGYKYAHISLAGASGGDGLGGGLYAAGGSVTLRSVSVTANLAQGGAGGSGLPNGKPGQGVGGGLYIEAAAFVGLDTFTKNHVKNNRAGNIFGSYVVIS